MLLCTSHSAGINIQSLAKADHAMLQAEVVKDTEQAVEW